MKQDRYKLRPYFEANYPGEDKLIELMLEMFDIFAHKPSREEMDAQLPHIADWLRGAIVGRERWLTERYGDGPIERFYLAREPGADFITLASFTRLADADMREKNDRAIGLVSLGKDEEEIMTFPDGYRIVRLTSPLALDAEGAHMGHCIGQGAYDAKLTGGGKDGQKYHFYSLRDAKNRPHATIEVDAATHKVVQLQGKANQPVIAKYMPYVRDFVAREKFAMPRFSYKTGILLQGGIYYNLHALPEGFCYKRVHREQKESFDLGESTVTQLPKNMSVRLNDEGRQFIMGRDHSPASLYIGGSQIRHLPDGLYVEGNLHAHHDCREREGHGWFNGEKYKHNGYHSIVESVGANTIIGGTLDLSYSQVRTLPADIQVGKHIILNNTPLESLPDGLSVDGGINVCHTPLAVLPRGLKAKEGLYLVDTNVTALPLDLEVGNELRVGDCPSITVPDGFKTPGHLTIIDVDSVTLGEDMVVGSLRLHGGTQYHLPERMVIEGNLELTKTGIQTVPPGWVVKGKITIDRHEIRPSAISPETIAAQRTASAVRER